MKLSGEIVLQYLRNATYASLPNLTLARIIYESNKEVFTNVETVRVNIRRYKGQSGELKRKTTQLKDFYCAPAEHANKLGIPNPYCLPEPEPENWEPFEIKGPKRLLILSDIHVPFHDLTALNLAIQYGKAENIDGIILNGDIADCYSVSRHERDPRLRSFTQEMDENRLLLRSIRDQFPNIPIYYKLGNHEERFEAYLKLKAPELFGAPEFKLSSLLRFGELGIQEITDKRIIKVGGLNVVHGHEFMKGIAAPVNPARGFYMKGKASVIAGHHHQTSEHTESDMNGHIVTCWSTGCLCQLHPQYMPINKHNHGFASVEVDLVSGDFEVQNMRIINGKIR